MQSGNIARRWIGLVATIAIARPLLAAPPEEPEKPKPKITISKVTTYITEPLRADGYPDYVAALNQRMSEGVTPENNAAVLLMRAVGPIEIRPGDRNAFFKLLYIEPLPEKGDYFVSEGEMIARWKRDHPRASDDEVERLGPQFGEATERPWTAAELPFVAKWMAVNEKPLTLATEAARREKCFFPFVGGGNTPVLDGSSRNELRPVLDVASCLCVRAMMKLGQKDTAGAWEDVLCCHRLARSIDQGSFFGESLFAESIERQACGRDVALLHFGGPSAKSADQMEAELRRLPPLKSPIDTLDLGERFIALDAMCSLARGAQSGNRAEPFILPELFDYDAVLKMGNEWYDKWVSAARSKDRTQRAAAIKAAMVEFEKLSKEKSSLGSLALDIATKGIQKGAAIQIGAKVLGVTLPTVGSMAHFQDRSEMLRQLNHVAFALAKYRAETGNYPLQLGELVPKYLTAVPENIFAKNPSPVWYRREGQAYALWVVGSMVNDADRRYEDGPDSSGYDLCLRPIPVKSDETK